MNALRLRAPAFDGPALALAAGVALAVTIAGLAAAMRPSTTLLGIVGSFVGGFLSSLFSHQPVSLFRPSGIIGSIIGALIVLAIWVGVSNRRTHTQAPV